MIGNGKQAHFGLLCQTLALEFKDEHWHAAAQ
jgi:hypothetical protein